MAKLLRAAPSHLRVPTILSHTRRVSVKGESTTSVCEHYIFNNRRRRRCWCSSASVWAASRDSGHAQSTHLRLEATRACLRSGLHTSKSKPLTGIPQQITPAPALEDFQFFRSYHGSVVYTLLYYNSFPFYFPLSQYDPYISPVMI